MTKDVYRDWSPEDRTDAWQKGDYDGCRRYDDDFDSSQRAYEQWHNRGEFQDPEPDHRFS